MAPGTVLDVSSWAQETRTTKRALSLCPHSVSGFVFCKRAKIHCLGGRKIAGLSPCPKENEGLKEQGGHLDIKTDPQEVRDLG